MSAPSPASLTGLQQYANTPYLVDNLDAPLTWCSTRRILTPSLCVAVTEATRLLEVARCAAAVEADRANALELRNTVGKFTEWASRGRSRRS
jgi:hypothetical protein